jgi:hypothetical protein
MNIQINTQILEFVVIPGGEQLQGAAPPEHSFPISIFSVN